MEKTYRQLYGRLYGTLLQKFGPVHIQIIEDAIQNTFIKALKLWSTKGNPENKEAWLYTVCKNDILNQLKHISNLSNEIKEDEASLEEKECSTDPRLRVLFILLNLNHLSNQALTLFALKNVFGLSISEITQCTETEKEAIYKSVQRTKLILVSQDFPIDVDFEVNFNSNHISTLLQILYSVFNVSYDSKDENKIKFINEDLCLDVLAIALQLLNYSDSVSLKNFIALICFQSSRFEARTHNNNFIPFFNQDRTKWNKDLIQIGLQMIAKPIILDNYYIEAIIASKHCTNINFNAAYWKEISQLYNTLYHIEKSERILLAKAYCLMKCDEINEAIVTLKSIKEPSQKDSYYYLMLASLYENIDADISLEYLKEAKSKTSQNIKLEYIDSLIIERVNMYEKAGS